MAGPSKPQPELPNCLAVSSCMVICQASNKVTGRPTKVITGVKPPPEIKPPPETKADNKMWSNGPESSLDRNQIGLYSGTSSSSLYSFLKTSSDEKTNDESGEDHVKVNLKEKRIPTLKDPFWNTRITWNKDLKYKYTMPQTDLEEVLSEDKKKLKNMIQPELVTEQLRTLSQELDKGVELEEFLEDLHCPPTDDETETETDQENSNEPELEEKLIRLRRRKHHLDKMNIFMEAEAPFPMPDSSILSYPLPSNYKNSLRNDTASHSRTGSSLAGSSQDSLKAFRNPSKKFRFGQTSSLSGERSEYRTEDEGEKVDVGVMVDLPNVISEVKEEEDKVTEQENDKSLDSEEKAVQVNDQKVEQAEKENISHVNPETNKEVEEKQVVKARIDNEAVNEKSLEDLENKNE